VLSEGFRGRVCGFNYEEGRFGLDRAKQELLRVCADIDLVFDGRGIPAFFCTYLLVK